MALSTKITTCQRWNLLNDGWHGRVVEINRTSPFGQWGQRQQAFPPMVHDRISQHWLTDDWLDGSTCSWACSSGLTEIGDSDSLMTAVYMSRSRISWRHQVQASRTAKAIACMLVLYTPKNAVKPAMAMAMLSSAVFRGVVTAFSYSRCLLQPSADLRIKTHSRLAGWGGDNVFDVIFFLKRRLGDPTFVTSAASDDSNIQFLRRRLIWLFGVVIRLCKE